LKIAILHLGNMSQLIPATSVIKGIKKQDIDTDITLIVAKNSFFCLGKYNNDINRMISIQDFAKEKKTYDLLINLYSYFPENLKTNAIIKEATGFCFCNEYDKFKGVFSGKSSFLDMNIFQLYYKLCGLTWKGEGYDIKYYPKTKEIKKRIGLYVSDANLRNYVLDNLKTDGMKIWYIPYRKNIFKKIDEINRCKKIITDDMTTFYLSGAFRKYVYYLKKFPLNVNLEFFGNGEIYDVPITIFQ